MIINPQQSTKAKDTEEELRKWSFGRVSLSLFVGNLAKVQLDLLKQWLCCLLAFINGGLSYNKLKKNGFSYLVIMIIAVIYCIRI